MVAIHIRQIQKSANNVTRSFGVTRLKGSAKADAVRNAPIGPGILRAAQPFGRTPEMQVPIKIGVKTGVAPCVFTPGVRT